MDMDMEMEMQKKKEFRKLEKTDCFARNIVQHQEVLSAFRRTPICPRKCGCFAQA